MTDLRGSKITDLTGRVALVTGGGTGIGNIIARGLAANGAKVYITGRRKEVLEKAAAEGSTSSVGLNLIPLVLDVTDKDSIRSAAQFIRETETKLHILINNAGREGPLAPIPGLTNPAASTETIGRSIFESQNFVEWNDAYETNVSAIFFVTYAFLGLLEAGAHGLGEGETASVVNISSVGSITHMIAGRFCYLATKAAVNHLSVSMATEFALQKVPVRVNVVAPGPFPSEMLPPGIKVLLKSYQVMPGAVSAFPTKRLGREEEMTTCILSLVASAGYTNGQIIALDGGVALVNP